MANKHTDFGISFRALLTDVVQALGWPSPMYYKANLEGNQSNLVLVRGPGPTACFFRGESSRNLAESEEHSAEQAIDFLVQKKQIVVQDVNFERREKYKACCKFYKNKRIILEKVDQPPAMSNLSVDRKMKVSVPTCLSKTVWVDFWSIWLQVVLAYQVQVDEIDFIKQPDGRYVCCFTISWHKPSPKERYFIGDSAETLEKAKQSLARKAIGYLQSVYGFSVKDANFNRMLYSKIQCSFQRTRYLSAKEKHGCMVAIPEFDTTIVTAGYRTPEGPTYGIQSGLSIPPAPKRARVVAVASTSVESNLELGVGIVKPQTTMPVVDLHAIGLSREN